MIEYTPDTVGYWFRSGVATLEKAGIEGAERDVQIILANHLEVDPGRIRLMLKDPLPEKCRCTEFKRRYGEDIAARKNRKPVSKIIGKRAFWTSDFYVNYAVLDPRPDTETLIEAALGVGPCSRVLDLGTGSGAIAVTLALEWSAAQVIATDISEDALSVACKNTERLDVAGRVTLLNSNWFSNVHGTYDLIVSNPPYIALDEMAGLSAEVRDHDPRMALTDESDGLSCYRIIVAGAGEHLSSDGWLMVEIGPTQAQAVQDMFEGAGMVNIEIRTDLDGRDRAVLGQKPL